MSADGSFFSRWSQRKALVRQGAVLPAEPVVPAARPTPPVPACIDESAADHAMALAIAVPSVAQLEPLEPAEEPPPTLAEAQALSPSSDFTRFVGPGVDNQVKNAALRQLFSDPHFNVMDGLDTYIDDYGKSDPLPASMLRKMVQAHALGLFAEDPPVAPQPARDAEREADAEPAPETVPLPEGLNDAMPEGQALNNTMPGGLAQTDAMPAGLAQKMTETHENADLRLQPHDAAGWPSLEPGAEPDAGRTG